MAIEEKRERLEDWFSDLDTGKTPRWFCRAQLAWTGTGDWRWIGAPAEVVDGKVALDIGLEHMKLLDDGTAELRVMSLKRRR